LPPSCPNAIYLKKIEEALNNQAESIGNLLFGDWGLQDIRVWREKQFNNRGYSCRFPIWHKNMDQLLQILAQEPVHVHISAVAEKYKNVIKIGELYDEQFIKHLPDRINPMGEKGEFHTEVRFRI
jgi:diphthamide synthase (EF-2-diphthine--ammonia ligase)